MDPAELRSRRFPRQLLAEETPADPPGPARLRERDQPRGTGRSGDGTGRAQPPGHREGRRTALATQLRTFRRGAFHLPAPEPLFAAGLRMREMDSRAARTARPVHLHPALAHRRPDDLLRAGPGVGRAAHRRIRRVSDPGEGTSGMDDRVRHPRMPGADRGAGPGHPARVRSRPELGARTRRPALPAAEDSPSWRGPRRRLHELLRGLPRPVGGRCDGQLPARGRRPRTHRPPIRRSGPAHAARSGRDHRAGPAGLPHAGRATAQ